MNGVKYLIQQSQSWWSDTFGVFGRSLYSIIIALVLSIFFVLGHIASKLLSRQSGYVADSRMDGMGAWVLLHCFHVAHLQILSLSGVSRLLGLASCFDVDILLVDTREHSPGLHHWAGSYLGRAEILDRESKRDTREVRVSMD